MVDKTQVILITMILGIMIANCSMENTDDVSEQIENASRIDPALRLVISFFSFSHTEFSNGISVPLNLFDFISMRYFSLNI